jgi:hypothetical protein
VQVQRASADTTRLKRHAHNPALFRINLQRPLRPSAANAVTLPFAQQPATKHACRQVTDRVGSHLHAAVQFLAAQWTIPPDQHQHIRFSRRDDLHLIAIMLTNDQHFKMRNARKEAIRPVFRAMRLYMHQGINSNFVSSQ